MKTDANDGDISDAVQIHYDPNMAKVGGTSSDATIIKNQKIEASINAVLAAAASPTIEITNDRDRGILSTGDFSSVSKKSLAASLPYLSGMNVDASQPTVFRSSTTTSTAVARSRQLNVVGDLPENVLETSCTPPSSPSKNISGTNVDATAHMQAPIFANLTPVGLDSICSVTSTDLLSTNLVCNSPLSTTYGSLPPTTTILLPRNSNALTQLIPMSAGVASDCLSVKVEPQDMHNLSMDSSGMMSTCSTSAALLLPPLIVADAGTICSNASNTATFADFRSLPTMIGGATVLGSTNSGNVGASGEFYSLQPAAVYVQPVQQNVQVQYIRLEMPSNISVSSSPHTSVAISNNSKLTTPTSTVSTVELAHNIIATMFQQPAGTPANTVQPVTTAAPQFVSVENKDASTRAAILFSAQNDSNAAGATKILTEVKSSTTGIRQILPSVVGAGQSANVQNVPVPATTISVKKRSISSSGVQQQELFPNQTSVKESCATGGGGRTSSVSGDEGDDIYIDTKELCNRIAYELKAHSIPQAVFAERVLCRSQGTLSDLLRNPKPWNKLKSGRETFRRMYAWLKMPLAQRLTSLELWKCSKRKSSAGGEESESKEEPEVTGSCSDPSDEVMEEDADMASDEAVPSTSVEHNAPVNEPVATTILPPAAAGQQSPQHQQQQKMIKKPRLVFTDIQKRTLQAIFKETQRPSREMQQTIAEHLGLDLSTVQNFFMNARRRSRIDQPIPNDSPTPFQQVRTITPPPDGLLSPSSGTESGEVLRQNDFTATPALDDSSTANGKKKRVSRRRPQPSTKRQSTTSKIVPVDQKGAKLDSVVTLPSMVLDSEEYEEEEDDHARNSNVVVELIGSDTPVYSQSQTRSKKRQSTANTRRKRGGNAANENIISTTVVVDGNAQLL